MTNFPKLVWFQKDWLWGALIFFLALIFAGQKVESWTHKPFFYQSYFEPAVMLACGHGIYAHASGANTKLDDFLNLKTAQFSCSDLPTEIQSPVIGYGHRWYYMMYTVGYLWKITGVQWKTLDRLVVLFYGFTSIFAFMIFRLWGNRITSFFGALFFVTSPLQLDYLSLFRDYSKVPFILGVILLLGLEIKKQRAFRTRLVFPLLAGILTGLGYGFRADLLILVPFVFLIYFTLGRRDTRWPLFKNIILVCVYGASFVLVISPMYNIVSQKGTCTWHFLLLGTADGFNKKLGLNQYLYGLTPEYNDRSGAFVAASYAERNLGDSLDTSIRICSQRYDQITKEIIIDFATTFPADFFRRFLAAIPNVLTERNLGGFNLFIIALFIPIAWLMSKRLTIFYAFSIFYLCGYAFLQFQQRHYFYLEFLVWVAVVGVSNALICRAKFAKEPHKLFNLIFVWNQFRSLLMFLGIFFLAVWGLDYGLKSYQIERLTKRSFELDSLGREPVIVDLKESDFGLGIDLSRMEKVFSPDWVTSDLLVLSINSFKCIGNEVDIKLLYSFTDNNPNFDLSRSVKLHIAPGENFRNFYFPVYHQSNIKGVSSLGMLQLLKQPKDCFAGISKITDRSGVSLWTDFSVPRPMQKEGLVSSFNSEFFSRLGK